MKIKDRKIEGANVEIIPIPRGNGQEDIIFMAKAVLDYDDFHKMCPFPRPPMKMMKGGGKVMDFDDEFYKQQSEDYGKKKTAWMIINSLSATEGLVWETVNLGDPSTWLNYQKEMIDSGLSDNECAMIVRGVQVANALDENKIEEARQRFLLSREAQKNASSSQGEGQNGTPSGELVNVRESVSQG